jgi:general secretion pathway protein H
MTRPGQEHAESGFTLLETLLGVAVLAFVAVVSTPLVRRPSPNAQVAADAASLAAAMRVTRAAAMMQGRELVFSIDRERREFGSSVVPPRRFRRGTEVNARFARHEDVIRFYPNGSASRGEVTLRSQAAEARIVVNWATGHAFIIR